MPCPRRCSTRSPSGSTSPTPSRARSTPRGLGDLIAVIGGRFDAPGDEAAMRYALELARRSADAAEIPVGAVVLDASGRVLAEAHNDREAHHDPTAHAEVVALRAAGEALGTWQLAGTTLVVTLEPCTMCAGALVLARVARLVFGAWDPKAGAVGSLWDVVRDRRSNHRPEVRGGVLEDACGSLLREFFASRRSERGAPSP